MNQECHEDDSGQPATHTHTSLRIFTGRLPWVNVVGVFRIFGIVGIEMGLDIL